MIYIGIDNGVTGSVGVVKDNGRYQFYKTPCFMEQNYTKTKGNISRIDHDAFYFLLKPYANKKCKAFLERPMVNPGRYKATISAIRALESSLIIIEALHIPYEYVDSKGWQKELLPKGTKGVNELKKASVDIGCRLFPKFKNIIRQHKDADGLLIAEYARRIRK